MRVKTEARRQSIIKAARDVFREMGYERASMSEIAARLGGSKATLYSYFKSKEELFIETLRGSEQIVHVFGPLFEPERTMATVEDFRAELERFATEWLKLVLWPDMIAMRRNLIAIGGHSDIAKTVFEAGPRMSFQVVANYIGHAVEKGYLRQSDPWIATKHLLRLLEAEHLEETFMGLLKTVTPKMIRDAVKRALDVFWRGYAPEQFRDLVYE